MGNKNAADVQYNDLNGTAALDFHGSIIELRDYAKSFGIDVERYKPIGINLYLGEIDFFSLSFYCTDIVERKTMQIMVDESWKKFNQRFKRLNIILTSEELDPDEDIEEVRISRLGK